jgi:hypothetical protein
MHAHPRFISVCLAGLAAVVAAVTAARADVTVEQQTSFDFAIVKAHGKSTELTTADKQRNDSDLHCDGFMKMLCGNAQSAQIIRLDRGIEWTLEPKRMEYREAALPTAAQRAAAQQAAQAMMEKMKQCPAMQQGTPTASTPDTSKCQLSDPKIDVKQTGSHATFAGHDTQLTQIALTQSCTDKSTGDVCDFVFTVDSWLTQDAIPGFEEHKVFQQSYRQKLGIDEVQLQAKMQQFLAPYAGALKQLSAKGGELKGQPLKTSLRIAFGGERCAVAKSQGTAGSGNAVADAGQAAGNAAATSASGVAGTAAGTAAANVAGNSAGGSVLSSAASAFGSKLTSGLFQHKSAAPPPPSASAAGPADGLAPGMVQAAEITIETTAITTGTIPAAQFDIPAGWKLVQPEPKAEREFSCPKQPGA